MNKHQSTSAQNFSDMAFDVGIFVFFIASWFFAYSIKGIGGIVLVSLIWVIVGLIGQEMFRTEKPLETNKEESSTEV